MKIPSEIREKYTAVIGLEVHAQLLTQSKMFAPEATSYGALPNTQISTVVLAHPGTLPTINKRAIEYAIKMGLACRSKITRENIFARKSYFYPDLPKGFQITQHKTPICQGGTVTITTKAGAEKNIALTRIHLEEDTGKSIHGMVAGETLIDYNRAGVPLIEIVTQPTLRTSDEAYAFLSEIRKLVRYLDICDGNMEEGSLRCDANVSVMLKEAKNFGTKVEVKNMNSIRHVQLAIEHEIIRQITCLEAGETIVSTTRSFDAATNTTSEQRTKELANDYRYFPEPDLSPLIVSEQWLADIQQEMPLLPRACYRKFIDVYGLSPYDAAVLTDSKEIATFFDALCDHTQHYKAAANWLIGPVKAYLNERSVAMQAFPLSIHTLAALVDLVASGKVNFSAASQQLYPALLEQPEQSPEALAAALQLLQEKDTETIETLITEVLSAHPDKVAAYKNGKKGLLGMLMGEMMKKSQGKIDPKVTHQLLQQHLEQSE